MEWNGGVTLVLRSRRVKVAIFISIIHNVAKKTFFEIKFESKLDEKVIRTGSKGADAARYKQ